MKTIAKIKVKPVRLVITSERKIKILLLSFSNFTSTEHNPRFTLFCLFQIVESYPDDNDSVKPTASVFYSILLIKTIFPDIFNGVTVRF